VVARSQPRTSAARRIPAGQLARRQHKHRPAEGEAHQHGVVEDPPPIRRGRIGGQPESAAGGGQFLDR